MLPEPISEVPSEQVGEIVQEFIDYDGVKRLKVEQQANGKFTVTPLR